MEAIPAKNTDAIKSSLNLILLEEKITHLITLIKKLKEENFSLRNKNKDLQAQLKELEVSLVAETKTLEDLSQEKATAKMVVDDLLHSINEFIEIKEK